jgi:hypothetical protein
VYNGICADLPQAQMNKQKAAIESRPKSKLEVPDIAVLR